MRRSTPASANPQGSQQRMVLPRWVRLTPEGQALVHREWLAAGENKASEGWLWFCDIVDYREGCNRTSRFQTWRTRLIRGLVWLAERIATGTWQNSNSADPPLAE